MYINETIQKRSKYSYTYYQNTHPILKIPTDYKIHTYTHPLILSWIFRKWGVGVWTGTSWLRIGTGGGHL